MLENRCSVVRARGLNSPPNWSKLIKTLTVRADNQFTIQYIGNIILRNKKANSFLLHGHEILMGKWFLVEIKKSSSF